ncbi:MAG: hypothetical protein MUC48_04885 [Leptolyngbya sp. Prado105]|jgi:hypothetical protein|nr:hypothetical protein [Leptolyngbya sp. Prado105]
MVEFKAESKEEVSSTSEIIMAHFTVLVIIPPRTMNIQKTVRELLNPFYSELNVEPYREYLDQRALSEEIRSLSMLPEQEIEKLARKWEVPHDDLVTLAKLNLDWCDDEVVGTDENGAYRTTTINPLGKWDSYSFIEAETDETAVAISYPCQVSNLLSVVPYAILTPDGQWHEAGSKVGMETLRRSLLETDEPESSEEVTWNLIVEAILARYSDYSVVALNCHV